MAVVNSTPLPLKLRTTLLVTMVILQVGDYLSTMRGIALGYVEGGPLGRLAETPVSLAFFKAICVLAFAAILYRDKFPIAKRLRIGALVCAFYLCVVLSNLSI